MASDNYLALIARHRALNDFTTVRAQFMSGGQKHYTYLVPRAWNVVVGDQLFVLVSGTTPAQVIVREVDRNPYLPINVDYVYRWAAAKFDRTTYDQLCNDTIVAESAIGQIKQNMLIDAAAETYKKQLKPIKPKARRKRNS